MTEFFHTYLLEIGLFILILLATGLTHFFARNRSFTLIVFGLSCLVFILVLALGVLSSYVNTHVVAEFIDGTLNPTGTDTGWSLLVTAWPVWVVPCLFTAFITALICLLTISGQSHDYLAVVQQAGKEEQSTGPTATSSRLVMKQLEINELQRKLEISEEKFRQAKDTNKQKPVRLDKYMNELSELRQKTSDLDRQVRAYREENQRLTSELSDAQRLIDDLMRS